MKRVTVHAAQLLRKIHTDESFIYSFICYSFAVIHFILLFFFEALNVLPLTIYSIFSVTLYIYLGFTSVKKRRSLLTLIVAECEILVHSSLCCFLIGWNYGFMLYTLAMIPVIFYLLTTTNAIKLKHPMLVVMLFSSSIIVCFVLSKIATDRMAPYYTLDVIPLFVTVVYCINCCIAFTMQTLFSFLYSLEIQHFKENLEQEKMVLDDMAKKDPLTDLLNRRAMGLHLDTAKSIAEQKGDLFCLILCDIDNFKKINDVYGHETGDLVLKTVANTFVTNLRTGDYVCRWGGEEFLILIPNDLTVTLPLAEHLREQIAKLSFKSELDSFSITMTFGVSEYIPGYRIEKII